MRCWEPARTTVPSRLPQQDSRAHHFIQKGVVVASSNRGSSRLYRCSFCRKGETESNRLVAGPDRVFICYECVRACKQVIDQNTSAPPAQVRPRHRKPPVPREINELLDG
ncbi:MAG: hypothetical protein J4F46_10265, partial [Dehalococcoidia bacterium]|nr:hypothetical protein [Dehalococcoidia bacterium]